MEKLDSNQAAEFRRHHERVRVFDQGLHYALPVVQVLWLGFFLAALADVAVEGASTTGTETRPGWIYQGFHGVRNWLWLHPVAIACVLLVATGFWLLSSPWTGSWGANAKSASNRLHKIQSVPGLAAVLAGILILGASFSLSALQTKSIGWESGVAIVPALAWLWWRFGAFRQKTGPSRGCLVFWRILMLVLCFLPFPVMLHDWYDNRPHGNVRNQNAQIINSHRKAVDRIADMLGNMTWDSRTKIGEKELREAQATFQEADRNAGPAKPGGTPSPSPNAIAKQTPPPADKKNVDDGGEDDNSGHRKLSPYEMALILRLLALLGGDLFAFMGDGSGGGGGGFDDAAADRIANAINRAPPEQKESAILALKEMQNQNPKLTPRYNMVQKALNSETQPADAQDGQGKNLRPPAATPDSKREKAQP